MRAVQNRVRLVDGIHLVSRARRGEVRLFWF
jgi:hypothetical protein